MSFIAAQDGAENAPTLGTRVVIQKTKAGEVNSIIEAKGRVWESTAAKDDAITGWCKRVGEETGKSWDFRRINQSVFDSKKWQLLSELRGQPATLPRQSEPEAAHR